MPMPQISVVMAVYNGGEYLKLAIESILEQSFTDFEFIIINDGSTDSTPNVLTEYAHRDRRIRIISRENKGLVASLNEGISEARAPLIARMDADDIALPQRLFEQLNYLEKNPNVVCIGTAQIIIDDDGDELTTLKVPTDNDKIQRLLLSGHCPLEHPSVMYRTESVNQVGGYRKEYETAEDYDLWLRLSEVGEFANINKPLLKYRYLNSSISASNQQKQKNLTMKACNEAWRRRGIEGQFSATEEWRATSSISSQHRFALKFGWWAFNYNNKKAAIKYAKRSIRLKPFAFEGWNLLLNAFIKLKGSHE